MMNERIRELFRQASTEPWHPDDVGSFDAEKFAELIVRECAAVADGNFNTGFCPVGGFITEHFGFER